MAKFAYLTKRGDNGDRQIIVNFDEITVVDTTVNGAFAYIRMSDGTEIGIKEDVQYVYKMLVNRGLA